MDSPIPMPVTLRYLQQWFNEPNMIYVPEQGGCVRTLRSSSPQEGEPTNGERPSALTDSPFLNPEMEWDEYTCPRKLHTYLLPPDGGFQYAIGTVFGPIAISDNLCPMCFVEWLNMTFPTRITGKGKPPGLEPDGEVGF